MPIINVGGPANNTNANSLIPDPIFGSGKDGNVVISASTTLTRDMYYKNLTINQGVHVNTAGYRVFVRNILLLNGSSSQDANTSIGLKNGSSTIGSLGAGSVTSASISLGGNSASYTITSPPSSIGGSNYFDDPENGTDAFYLNASQTTPLFIKGGAGNGTQPGGGVVVISARSVSGNGTIYADGFNNGTSYTTGGGVIFFCSSKIKPSTIALNVSGYQNGTAKEYIV
jgi:hypothetical protein